MLRELANAPPDRTPKPTFDFVALSELFLRKRKTRKKKKKRRTKKKRKTIKERRNANQNQVLEHNLFFNRLQSLHYRRL